MESFIYFLLNLAILALAETKDDWKLYKTIHNLEYNDQQTEKAKQDTWAKNLNYVDDHNKEFLAKHVTDSLGVNQFSHLSYEEAISKYTGFKRLYNRTKSASFNQKSVLQAQLPAFVDWTKTNLVGPIKNQLHCG